MLDFVKFYLYNSSLSDYDEINITRHACIGGSLPVLDYLCSRGHYLSPELIYDAAVANHFEIVNYLLPKIRGDMREALISAVQHNNKEMIQILIPRVNDLSGCFLM